MTKRTSIQPLSPLSFQARSIRMPEVETDPRPTYREAVAISYLENSGAPKIIAKGRGLLAEKIVETAQRHGVFVHESRELLMILSSIELDKEIPPELYKTIATLLSWVHDLENSSS